MTNNKYKITVVLSIDEADYPFPSDGNICQQLKDDVEEALQSAFECEIEQCSVKGI